MSDWPRGMVVAPIREWPGTLRAQSARRPSPFLATKKTTRDGRTLFDRKEVSLTDTLGLLERELDAIRAKEVELLVAIPAGQFRLDGRPRADAKPEHPGVVLSFETKVGQLAYPCDTFTTWQANLRGIALSLEALRKVDRYGVTSHGEQYRGFLAIESSATTSVDEARAFLYEVASPMGGGWTSDDAMIRAAKRRAHPDTGGNPDLFQQVLDAERILTGRAA